MRKIPFLLILYWLVVLNINAQNVDSLYSQLDTSTVDSVITNTQLVLANHYFYYDTDSARKYYWQFVKLNKNELENAHATSKIGVCYAFDSKFDSALYYMGKAREVFSEEQDSLNIAYSYNSIGLVKINTGKYAEGIKSLLNSIKWKECLVGSYPTKTLQLASTFLNIGIGFQSLGQFDKAMEYYNKAQQEYVNENNKRGEYSALVQIAGVHFEKENFEEAKKLYIQIDESLVFEKNPYSLVKVYNNLGATLSRLGSYDEAESILLKAFDLNTKLGIDFSACKNLNNLGLLFYYQNNATKAIEYGIQALDLANKVDNISSQQTAMGVLADSYELNGQYKQSVEYHKQGNALSDSINEMEMNKTIADLESKYQLEKKQQTIQNLEIENQLRNLEIKRKNTVNLLTTLMLLVFVVALFFVIKAFRKVRKQKVLLDEKNRELETLNDSLNKMFAIISHDLRNLISGFKGSGDLVAFYLENKDTQKLKKLASHLSENANRLEVLLNNLLNWALSQGEIYSPQPKTIVINEYIDSLIALSENQAEEKNIAIENRIEAGTEVFADPNNFSFIFRNLLSNSLKFTENGTVIFSAETSNEKTIITVVDSGVGISPEKLDTIFTLKEDKKSVGTSGEKGTGLGLKLVHDFVTLNVGSIKVKSELNKGTTVILEFPNA